MRKSLYLALFLLAALACGFVVLPLAPLVGGAFGLLFALLHELAYGVEELERPKAPKLRVLGRFASLRFAFRAFRELELDGIASKGRELPCHIVWRYPLSVRFARAVAVYSDCRGRKALALRARAHTEAAWNAYHGASS